MNRKAILLTKEEARKVAIALEDGHALTSEDQVLWQTFRALAGQSTDLARVKRKNQRRG